MHSEIHLRWANWVEHDFPSHWVWQTWGHSRERAAQRRTLKEAGVRSWCLRSHRPEISQRQQSGARNKPNDSKTILSHPRGNAAPIPIISQVLPSVTQVKDRGAILGSSFFQSHPLFDLTANHFSLVFKIQNTPEYFSPCHHTCYGSSPHHASSKWLTQPPNQSSAPPPQQSTLNPAARVIHFFKSTAHVPHLLQTPQGLPTHSK